MDLWSIWGSLWRAKGLFRSVFVLTYVCLVVRALLKRLLCCVICLCSFVSNLFTMCRTIYSFSVLFRWSIPLFFHQQYIVLFPVALSWVLKLDITSRRTLFLCIVWLFWIYCFSLILMEWFWWYPLSNLLRFLLIIFKSIDEVGEKLTSWFNTQFSHVQAVSFVC